MDDELEGKGSSEKVEKGTNCINIHQVEREEIPNDDYVKYFLPSSSPNVSDSDVYDSESRSVCSNSIIMEQESQAIQNTQAIHPSSKMVNVSTKCCTNAKLVESHHDYPRQQSHEGTKKVVMVFPQSPSSFYIRLADHSSFFMGFTARLNAAYSGNSRNAIARPQQGMPCVAWFNNHWQRGQIVDTFIDCAEILFVDYGYKHSTPWNLVKEMENEFLDLPPEAYHCVLEGIPSSRVWNNHEIDGFESFTMGKQLTATFSSKTPGPMSATKFSIVLTYDHYGSTISINHLFTRTAVILTRSVSNQIENADAHLPKSLPKVSDGLKSKPSNSKQTLEKQLIPMVSTPKTLTEGIKDIQLPQEKSSNGLQWVNYPNVYGCMLHFEATGKHFYRITASCIRNCADSQFFFAAGKKLKYEIEHCKKTPKNISHGHPTLSQEMLELAVIRWECALRIISRPQETNSQSVEAAVSSWPHRFNYSLSSIESKFSPVLNRYRNKATSSETFVRDVLNDFGEDKLVFFRKLILQFRSERLPVETEVINFQAGPSKQPEKRRVAKKRGIDEESAELKNPSDGESANEILSPQLEKTLETAQMDSIDGPSTSRNDANETEMGFVQQLLQQSKKIDIKNGFDWYAAPLTGRGDQQSSYFNRLVFGQPGDTRKEHKTMLLVGAALEKIDFINNMFNFIIGVDLTDRFRFQLVSHVKTKSITIYDIHHVDGFRIPCSLTIVDLADVNQDLTDLMDKFLQWKDGIQRIDAIGLVALRPRDNMQSFDSVLSVFGNDLEENLSCLITSPIAGLRFPADPNIKGPIYYFDRSLTSSNSGDGWKEEMNNFQMFFSKMLSNEAKSTMKTNRVISDRKLLEETVGGLQLLIQAVMEKLKQAEETLNFIDNMEIEPNVTDETVAPQRVDLPARVYANNCKNCKVTCSMYYYPRITTTSCSKCPGNCAWSSHDINVSHRLMSTSDSENGNAGRLARNLGQFYKELKEMDSDATERSNIVLRCIERLNRMSLRPFSTTPESIDRMIKAQQILKRPGFQQKIELLEKRHQHSKIINKIINKKPLRIFDLIDHE